MTTDRVEPDFETVCVACGGRGGWWTFERRDKCGRCAGTGWEPSAAIQRLLRDQSQQVSGNDGGVS